MIRSFAALTGIDPGFDPRGVLTMVVSVTGAPEAQPQRRAAFYQELVERVRALPGVKAASAINHLPLAGDLWGWPFTVEGRPLPRPGESPTAAYRVVLPGYFEAMGIPLLQGRDVTPADRLGSPGVVVVNDWMARRHWPGQDPIGKRMCFEVEFPADGPPLPTWREVVGVVGHVKHYGLSQESRQQIYVSHRQMPLYSRGQLPAMTVVVRAPGGGAAGATLVRSALRALGEGVPVHNVRTLESALAGSVSRNRISAWLMSMFAGAALLLAVVGIFGLVSYAVSQRTAEIGVRMALGAGRREVWRLFVGEGMKPVLVGTALGLAGAVALTRALAGLLFEVSPTDPATFGAVAVLLATVALIACWRPARRAVRVDPVAALRAE
jgi:putative ABC transport system permease protein